MNDICKVIDLLQSNDFYGCGENIEIAKGKFEKVYSWNDGLEKVKRIVKSKSND